MAPALFAKNALPSPLNCFGTFVKNQKLVGLTSAGPFLRSPFYTIDLFVYLFINTTILTMDLHTECSNRLD